MSEPELRGSAGRGANNWMARKVQVRLGRLVGWDGWVDVVGARKGCPRGLVALGSSMG